jgi:hypothetical protein
LDGLTCFWCWWLEFVQFIHRWWVWIWTEMKVERWNELDMNKQKTMTRTTVGVSKIMQASNQTACCSYLAG